MTRFEQGGRSRPIAHSKGWRILGKTLSSVWFVFSTLVSKILIHLYSLYPVYETRCKSGAEAVIDVNHGNSGCA